MSICHYFAMDLCSVKHGTEKTMQNLTQIYIQFHENFCVCGSMPFQVLFIALVIIIDAPFDMKYIAEVISLASDQLRICRSLMENYDESQFEDYLKKNPRGFSWKNVALILYKSGEERSLNQLFNLMRSPEGKQHFLAQN